MSQTVQRLTERYGVAGATLDLEVPVKRRFGRTSTETVTANVIDLSVAGALLEVSQDLPAEVGQRFPFRRGDAQGELTLRHLRRSDASDAVLCGVFFVSMSEEMQQIVHEAVGTLRGSDRVEDHWNLNR